MKYRIKFQQNGENKEVLFMAAEKQGAIYELSLDRRILNREEFLHTATAEVEVEECFDLSGLKVHSGFFRTSKGVVQP